MDADVQAQVTALAETAVQHAQQSFHTELDYSPESLHLVEEILGKLHFFMPNGFIGRLLGRNTTPEQLPRMATVYGAYIGEVIRSRLGANGV